MTVTGPGSIPAAYDHSILIATVISTTVSLIVFFTCGFVCGCFCHKYKQSILALGKTPMVQPSTVFSDLKEEKQDSPDLKMTDNVAYGPVQPAAI